MAAVQTRSGTPSAYATASASGGSGSYPYGRYTGGILPQHLGPTLDIGCGIGRNLGSLPPGPRGAEPGAN